MSAGGGASTAGRDACGGQPPGKAHTDVLTAPSRSAQRENAPTRELRAALLDLARDHHAGRCAWPGTKRLAWFFGVTTRTLQLHLNELHDRGDVVLRRVGRVVVPCFDGDVA